MRSSPEAAATAVVEPSFRDARWLRAVAGLQRTIRIALAKVSHDLVAVEDRKPSTRGPFSCWALRASTRLGTNAHGRSLGWAEMGAVWPAAVSII